MATGTIASVRDKGFGFIAGDEAPGTQDLFFHRTAVHADGFDRLLVGQRVRYQDEADPRNPSRRRAANVEPVDAEESDESAWRSVRQRGKTIVFQNAMHGSNRGRRVRTMDDEGGA